MGIMKSRMETAIVGAGFSLGYTKRYNKHLFLR